MFCLIALRASDLHIRGLYDANRGSYWRRVFWIQVWLCVLHVFLAPVLVFLVYVFACKQRHVYLLRCDWRAPNHCAGRVGCKSVVWGAWFQIFLRNMRKWHCAVVIFARVVGAFAHKHDSCKFWNNKVVNGGALNRLHHTPHTQSQSFFSSRFSSISRRITSETVMPSSLARSCSHFICGCVKTIERWCLVAMAASEKFKLSPNMHFVKTLT